MPEFLLLLSLFIIFNFLSVFCELCGEILLKKILLWYKSFAAEERFLGLCLYSSYDQSELSSLFRSQDREGTENEMPQMPI